MPLGNKDLHKDREQEKPAADLLRRSLASAASAEDVCPEPEILAAYSEHSLDADETARYELHFSQCAHCRELLVAMVHAGERAGTAGEDRARTPARAWLRDWRVLAPVAAALVLSAVMVARSPKPNRSAEQNSLPLVAMSKPSAAPAASASPESAPIAHAVAPSASPIAGALKRVAPEQGVAKSEVVPPPKSPASDKKETLEASNNLAPRERDYTRLDKLATPAVAPRADTSAGTANGVGIGTTSQTVTATEAAPPAKAVAPVPQELTTDAAVGGAVPAGASGGARGNGVGNGNGVGVAAESTQSKQMPAVATNGVFARSQAVMVEAPDDRFARTLVHSPDPQVLWRISSGRYVERSSDAGATWHAQWTNANARVVAGAAPSIETCWLVGRGGIVLLTTDGKNWKTISPPADADFVDVAATDASSATVTASDGRKFATSDGGKHWMPAP